MSDSTSPLDLASLTGADNVTPLNDLANASSPAAVFGYRRSTSSGLTWGYYGGRAMLAGVMVTISSSTVLLTASSTNYVELERSTGVVSANTSGFTAGRIPLYKVVTGAGSVTSWEDWRLSQPVTDPRAAVVMATDANRTASAAEAAAEVLVVTSSVSLTAQRNLVLPLAGRRPWLVLNRTTGGQAVQAIGATGTGVAIASNGQALVVSDGTNFVAV